MHRTEEPLAGGVETAADAPEPGSGRPDATTSGDVAPAADAGPEGSAGAAVTDGPEEAPGTPEAPGAADPVPVPPRAPSARRRVSVRRGVAVAGVALVGALAVSAFAAAPSSADVDQRFVDAVHAQGHAVGGRGQQALLVSAARKVCERRANHATVAQRRATTLSSGELAAVQQAFADDTRDFTVLALSTYC